MQYAEATALLRLDRGASVEPDGSVVVVERFEGPGGAPVEQRVTVRSATVRDRPWLLVYAEVCPAGQLDSWTAVSHGATLAVGGLCLHGGSYFLQHGLPLSAAHHDLEVVIDLLAHEAARLRVGSIAPAREAHQVFAGYAE